METATTKTQFTPEELALYALDTSFNGYEVGYMKALAAKNGIDYVERLSLAIHRYLEDYDALRDGDPHTHERYGYARQSPKFFSRSAIYHCPDKPRLFRLLDDIPLNFNSVFFFECVVEDYLVERRAKVINWLALECPDGFCAWDLIGKLNQRLVIQAKEIVYAFNHGQSKDSDPEKIAKRIDWILRRYFEDKTNHGFRDKLWFHYLVYGTVWLYSEPDDLWDDGDNEKQAFREAFLEVEKSQRNKARRSAVPLLIEAGHLTAAATLARECGSELEKEAALAAYNEHVANGRLFEAARVAHDHQIEDQCSAAQAYAEKLWHEREYQKYLNWVERHHLSVSHDRAKILLRQRILNVENPLRILELGHRELARDHVIRNITYHHVDKQISLRNYALAPNGYFASMEEFAAMLVAEILNKEPEQIYRDIFDWWEAVKELTDEAGLRFQKVLRREIGKALIRTDQSRASMYVQGWLRSEFGIDFNESDELAEIVATESLAMGDWRTFRNISLNWHLEHAEMIRQIEPPSETTNQ